MNNKFKDFISIDDEKIINKISYVIKHNDSKLLQHMEIIIESIKNNQSIELKQKKLNDYIEVFPIFIYRQNDYYYMYCHYPSSSKIYHFRFDTIMDIKETKNIDTIQISKKDIIKYIESSSNSFSKGNAELVNLKFNINDEILTRRIIDDFPNAILTKDGCSIVADENNVLYSKLCAYGDLVLICNKKVASGYKSYLENIIKNY